MAYFCPDCNLVFERQRRLCPKCGFGTANDNRDINQCVQSGYTLFTSSPATSENNSLQQNDPTALTDTRISSDTQPTKGADYDSNNSHESQSGANFFAQFAQSIPNVLPVRDPNEPPADTTSQGNTAPNTDFNDSFDVQLERDNRLYRNQRTAGRTRHSMGNIRWSVIFRLILTAFIIAAIVAIWSAREAIWAGIVEMISALIPLAIIVFAIIWFIRRFFR